MKLKNMKKMNKHPRFEEVAKKWSSLSFSQRIQYLWDYYKLHFVIAFIIVYIAAFTLYRQVTEKDIVLYAGLINIAPTPATEIALSDDYLTYINADRKTQDFKLYTGWYLTTDQSSEYFAYTNASQMKILATIDAEQLDVVFMDRESFDAFAQNGYLFDLSKLFEGRDLPFEINDHLINNFEILEDNAKDINFDPTVEFESTTVEYPMGIDISDSFVFGNASYSDTIYLGVIANTPRSEEVISYINYLYQQ